MRYSIVLSAAFAATAFGTPLKRDVIVETDTATEVDYVTDIITVTAGLVFICIHSLKTHSKTGKIEE